MKTARVAARLWGIDYLDTKKMTCRVTCRVWMFWKEAEDSKLFGAPTCSCELAATRARLHSTADLTTS